MTFTAEEKAACAERELKKRQTVYPRIVGRGGMTKAKADKEIRIMEEIAADYRAQAEGGRLL